MWHGLRDFFNSFFTGFKKTRFWQYKLAMVAVALAMLATVVSYTGFRAAISAIFSSPPITAQIGVGGVIIENGVFRDEFADGRLLEIKSRISKSDRNNSDIIFFEDLTGRLSKPADGKIASATASLDASDDLPAMTASPDAAMTPSSTAMTPSSTASDDISAMTPSSDAATASDDLPAMTASNFLAANELVGFQTSDGVLQVSKNRLLLSKEIEIKLSRGMTITTTALVLDFKKSTMMGNEPVKGISPSEEFFGEGISVIDDFNIVTLLGKSKVIFFSNPQ